VSSRRRIEGLARRAEHLVDDRRSDDEPRGIGPRALSRTAALLPARVALTAAGVLSAGACAPP
jgi:hypothetical protein